MINYLFFSIIFYPLLSFLIFLIATLALKKLSIEKRNPYDALRWLLNILFGIAIFAECFLIYRIILFAGPIAFIFFLGTGLLAFGSAVLANWLIFKFANSNKKTGLLVGLVAIIGLIYLYSFISIYKADDPKALFDEAYAQAVAERNPDACVDMKGSLNNSIKKTQCLRLYAIETGDAAVCEKILIEHDETRQKTIDSCYMNLAIMTNNVSLCSKVKTNAHLCPEIIALFNRAIDQIKTVKADYKTATAICPVDKEAGGIDIINVQYFQPYRKFERSYDKLSVDVFYGAAFACVSDIAKEYDEPSVCSVLPEKYELIGGINSFEEPAYYPKKECLSRFKD